MTELQVDAPEVVQAFNGGLTWLNRMSNSLEKYKLNKINSAQKGADGLMTIISALKMFDKDFTFRFVIDTNQPESTPKYLKEFKQLEP